MQVTIVHAGWLSAPNGASSVLRTLVGQKKLFSDNGIELSSYTMDDISPKLFQVVAPKRKSIKLRLIDYINRKSKYNSFYAVLLIYGYYLRHADKITKSFFQTQSMPQVVFLHDIFTCFYYFQNRPQCFERIPVVLVLHTNGDLFNMLRQYYKTLEYSWFYKQLYKCALKTIEKVDKIGFVARGPMEHFHDIYPDISAKKLFFVYNGLPAKEFTFQKNVESNENKRIKMICVGSVTERKGQRFIIEALRELSAIERSYLYITFVGDGDIKDELVALSHKYDIEECVCFAGISNRVDELLMDSDVFILASKDEGFPIAILEAMRMSLPIISTSIAGIPEMIDNEQSGLLIEPTVIQVKSVFQKINRYNWKLMGNCAHEKFNKLFTVQSMVNSYSKLFNSL